MDKADIELIKACVNLIGELKNEKIKDGVDDILSWVQDAVGDMAHEYNHLWTESKWNKKIQHAKEEGTIDITGWLADEYYNDVDTLQDLCGDRIHDKCIEILGRYEQPKSDMLFIILCEMIKEAAHPALMKAMDKLMIPHLEYIQKWKKTLQKRIS